MNFAAAWCRLAAVLGFAILVVILMIRPQGLFAAKVRR